MEWYQILSAIGTIVAIIAAVVALIRNGRHDTHADGQSDGEIKSDTQYIKRRIDDVLLEQKDTNKSINALSERVTRCEESAKQAHKRIDRLDGIVELAGKDA